MNKNRILAFNLYHDSSIAYVKDGKLIASLEGEKDSRPRFYAEATLTDYADLYHRLEQLHEVDPQVVACLGEYNKSIPTPYGTYYGIDHQHEKEASFFGKKVNMYSTTHERAHIFCSYALSPFPQGDPVYCLTYEGGIGKLYRIDENLQIQDMGSIIEFLGYKYEFLFILAGSSEHIHSNSPGKSMALAAFAEDRDIDKYREAILWLLYTHNDHDKFVKDFAELKEEYYKLFGDILPYNKGAESQHYKEFAYAFQTVVFEEHLRYLKKHCSENLPLLISGGCGLNCDWNQLWKNSGLFTDVFVPPCTNDSGIAIGIAAEAQFKYTGNAKLDWSVYAGEHFNENHQDFEGFVKTPLDYSEVGKFLSDQKIIAWVQGRYEIGPRALCNRSLVASPEKASTWDRLNYIKKREGYRPIAPVCAEEYVEDFFDWKGPSPYMLYFQNVKSKRLEAVTHVDNSARIQTVNADQNPQMHRLLLEMKELTDIPILCNTSLNFHSKGFINNSKDLYQYAVDRKLDGFVIGDSFYRRASLESETVVPMNFSGEKVHVIGQEAKELGPEDLKRGVPCKFEPVDNEYNCIMEIDLTQHKVDLQDLKRIDFTVDVVKGRGPWKRIYGERHALSIWADSGKKTLRDISYDDVIINGTNRLYIKVNVDFDKETYPKDYLTLEDPIDKLRFMYYTTEGAPGEFAIKNIELVYQK